MSTFLGYSCFFLSRSSPSLSTNLTSRLDWIMSRFRPIFIVYWAPKFPFSLVSILKTTSGKGCTHRNKRFNEYTQFREVNWIKGWRLEVHLEKSLNLVSTSRIYFKDERDRKIKELEKKLKKMENSQERLNLLW